MVQRVEAGGWVQRANKKGENHKEKGNVDGMAGAQPKTWRRSNRSALWKEEKQVVDKSKIRFE